MLSSLPSPGWCRLGAVYHGRYLSIKSSARNLVAARIVVNVPPNEQTSHEIGMFFLVAKKCGKMIEELVAFASAPIAPNPWLPRIHSVVEQLLRPWIDANRQGDSMRRKEFVEPVHLPPRLDDCALDSQRAETGGGAVICPGGAPPIAALGEAIIRQKVKSGPIDDIAQLH
jgi:hypothetical protein